MKTSVLEKIRTSLYDVVRNYPIELLLSITFFLIYCCVSDKGGLVFYVLLLFPVFFVLTYVFHRFAEGKYSGYIGFRTSFPFLSFLSTFNRFSRGDMDLRA